MTRRRLILNLTYLTIAVGFALAAVPFIKSMEPSDLVRENAKARVKISDIPENLPIERDYKWSKAFFVKNPQLAVFLVPYSDRAYRLPDPTWDQPWIPCKVFVANENGFSCEDPNLDRGYREQANWDILGVNKGTWMPDLIRANFKIENGYVVISPEDK